MTKASAQKIDKSEVIKLNSPKCALFGSAKDNNPACKKCAEKFEARQKACIALTAKSAKAKTVKKITGLSLDCFNARIESETHLFILEIAKNPQTMKSIKNDIRFHNTFYCKANSLIKSGNMLKNKSGTYALTSKGRKKLEKWIESTKTAAVKKVA